MKDILAKIRINGPILIVIAAILWALDGVIRRSLYSMLPLHIIFWEHLIGALILLPIGFAFWDQTKLSKKEWAVIIFVSFLSGLVGTLLFTTALLKTQYISFSVVFLLQKLQPLFAITTAVIFLKEKITKRYIGWALLALLAAYFVTFPNGVVNFGTGSATVIAALCALGAAAAWGSSTTFSKMALTGQNSTLITALRFWITTVMAFAAIVIFGKLSTFALPTITQGVRFLVIALSTGMVALLIYYRGLKTTPVRVSTILELAFPFLAVIIDVIAYHSVLAVSQYVAAAVLLFAMYKITVLQNNHEI
jgi:drug/metabolite transporter (DMT)-like permease